MRFIHHLSLFVLTTLAFTVNAEENVGQKGKKTSTNQYSSNRAATCTAPTSKYDLAINNVRARIMNGGDMWWDLSGEALYNVPRDGEVSSLFAGAIWIGGVDDGGQLKVAAQTYRQSGTDFYAGPLQDDGTTDEATCKNFDQHYSVLAQDIDSVIARYERKSGKLVLADIPNSVLKWPAKGNNLYNDIVENYSLASFFDRNGDDRYDPLGGDFPVLDLAGGKCAAEIVKPDEMVWWVYNDKGNIHGETGSEAIGVEIQGTAFGFATNDAINDMTFYRYRIANKSSTTLNDTYMAQWVDADLGYAFDDFVGCDPSRQLGICYNGDGIDGPAPRAYGSDLPMVGVDFFQGPIDTAGNELGMAVFLYYNNDPSVTGNPRVAPDYYGYISGFWKDGTPFTEGGNGYGGTVLSNYIFPSDPSDPAGWSECTQNNEPADRRFLQSAGPFVLTPGAVNNVTIGVVWVQQKNAEKCSSFKPIQAADDQAQALFNNCFKLLEGPKKPTVEVRELDEKIVLTISGYDITESYYEVDPNIQAFDSTIADSAYTFQGYIIYQLANKNVSASQLGDAVLSRVVSIVDVKDGVTNLVNFEYDSDFEMAVGEIKAESSRDEGVTHSFLIDKDLFATGSNELVNGKNYYFAVMPYGYNAIHDHRSDKYNDTALIFTKPYIETRVIGSNILATPHKLAATTELNADFGDGPEIIRVNGMGNSGNETVISDESLDSILTNSFVSRLKYKSRKGPIDVYVYDPLKVPHGKFQVVIDHKGAGTEAVAEDKWHVVYTPYVLDETGERTTELDVAAAIRIESDTSIGHDNEQIFSEYGIAIKLTNTLNVASLDTNGNPLLKNNGFISGTMTFEDPSKPWLTGIEDEYMGFNEFNWIRSGTECSTDAEGLNDLAERDGDCGDESASGFFIDPDENFEDILDGTWAPYALSNFRYFFQWSSDGQVADGAPQNFVLAPARHKGVGTTRMISNNIEDLSSVDVVFTSDKSKWTLSLVLEAQDDKELSKDGVEKLQVRTALGVNQDSVPFTTANDAGYAYFPGYAINVETGERLNILFSEDTWLKSDNGDDMMWNPTSTLFQGVNAPGGVRNFKYGGKHTIYIMDSRFSTSTLQEYKTLLADENDLDDVLKHAMWVTNPMLQNGFKLNSYKEGLIPTTTTVKLRVNKPLAEYSRIFPSDTNKIIYEFFTDSLSPEIKDLTGEEQAILDQINVVPNPYYGYSEYETSQLNNRIKITNLPNKCKVEIYSINGQFIRKFNRNVSPDSDGNTNTTLEWDLKNQNGIMVASGVYLIHVEVPKIGYRTLKWFGVMRPLDLDSF